MGVPSYFKWLYDNHRSSLISHKCPYKDVSSLYLDFNCLIHPACKERDGLTEKEMLQNVERYFRAIVDFVNPSEFSVRTKFLFGKLSLRSSIATHVLISG